MSKDYYKYKFENTSTIPRRSNSQGNPINTSFSYDYVKYQSMKRSPSASSQPLFLVIDLDHTLIYSSNKPFEMSDFVFTVSDSDNVETFYILKRPQLDLFLSLLIKFSTIYLYTTARRDYTTQILHNIDPMGKYFKRVFCREDCIMEGDNNFIKDISICNTDLRRTVIIDNNPNAYGTKEKHPNLLPISPFLGSSKDKELTKILHILKDYTYVDDVRTFIGQDNQ